MTRLAMIAALTVAALALSGCDQKKSEPKPAPSTEATAPANAPVGSQSAAVAAPDPNRPPTDAEIFSVFWTYWEQNGSRSVGGMVVPIRAEQLNDAVTQDTPYGKQRSVSVRYSFQVTAELTYSCGGFASAISVMPGQNVPPNAYPDRAHVGDTITCVIPASFSKIEEGWTAHILQNDARSYVIRR
jgi:hypothetical protein